MFDILSDVFDTCFNSWYKDDEKFTVTSATKVIKEKLRQNNCVLVVGRSGNGKTAIIRHLALNLFNEEGYDVIPIVLDLSTILQYNDPDRKQLFVLDDFCGKVETNDQTVQMWSVKIYEVMELIKKNPINAEGSVKLLFATQPFLFELSSFNTVDCLSKYKVLLSEIPLGDEEKIDMIKKYLPKDHEGKVPAISNHNKDIIPVLCKLSEGKTADQIIQLFKDPNKIIKKNFLQTNKNQICLLSLCVLFKSLTNDMFSQENTPNKNGIIEVVCSEFDLDFNNKTTKLKLKDELTNLEKTFFVKSCDTYYFVHKDIYNIAAVSCGEILKNIFIRFAYSSFIAERYSFILTKPEERENVIYIGDEETQKKYFDRLRNDLEQGITYSTFHNSQLEHKSYRDEFCTYCNDRKQNIVKILDQLQKRTSETPSNRLEIPIAPRKGSIHMIHEYEDYIDFTKPWQFSSHNMKIPLIESAWEGHKEIVNMLIEMERDVNETDIFGRSALFVACHRGKTYVAKLLLEKNADHSLCEANEKSPLYAACKGGHTQIVQSLLDKKAITSKCDKNGYSPLHAASAEGHKDIVPLLLAENNVDNCDSLGRSALFVASDKGRKGIVKLLLKVNANINECDLKGFSPLMAACSKGHSSVVDVLINAKPNDIKINDQDYDGRSALFIASKRGYFKIVDNLIKHKADELQTDCHQQSPLFIASYFGHAEVVRLLIENVKTISQFDEEGKTPLFIACEKGQEEIVEILLPKCSTKDVLKTDNKVRSPIYVACRGGFLGILKMLVGKGAQTDVSNIWDETPLFAASRGGHVMVVRYLIDNNMNKTNLDFAESNGHTPLWIACDEGNVEIVKLLVKKGAAINHQDNDKRTPLFAASKGNYVDVVRYLIDNQADLNSAESNGQTPLSIACDEGNVEIVNILVDKGADVNLQDNDNRTPLDVALIRGNTDIENILKQKLSTETKTANTNVKE